MVIIAVIKTNCVLHLFMQFNLCCSQCQLKSSLNREPSQRKLYTSMILSLKAMKMLAGVNIEAQIILKVSKFSCLGKKRNYLCE